jgi:hypothetical protein
MSKIKPLKTHVTAHRAVIRYTDPRDEEKAKSALQRTLTALGVKVEKKFHLPWKSCTGCNDPSCTYDAQDGYIGAMWESHLHSTDK